MDILKRSLAPITDEAWEEIDEVAREFLVSYLSARKFVDVSGPQGWDFAAITLGRLDVSDKQKQNEVQYGVCKVKPLVETRLNFKLKTWELDNISRGAKDAELDSLEKAAQKIAIFEENAIYNGLKEGGIDGIFNSLEHKPLEFKNNDGMAFLNAVGEGASILNDASIQKPYSLVINPTTWRNLAQRIQGYPLRKHINEFIDGDVIFSQNIDKILLTSKADGYFDLSLGQDFSIGYLYHDANEVTLFLTESFTFRVIEPNAAILLNAQ